MVRSGVGVAVGAFVGAFVGAGVGVGAAVGAAEDEAEPAGVGDRAIFTEEDEAMEELIAAMLDA